ncbi:FAD-containing monooxygenase EthA [Pseudomonas alcaligenes]|uniref:FAD-containing monooxygenase EthA n=1 Tax=Aquipseudomonas alcaligenes TaxID=43263 RepID=A0ABR7RZ43_AQUAC|nr:NAD(P)/FAD-dependent oxidoreductase [Pseudomonas alcaligenes]MBC9249601.1 FAD-containing monooxygenase EthA [Pseudomonas alcaligenes]
MSQHYDVLIIGAGLSGIGMASHLTRESPGLGYAVIERRQAIGGTWDLFRYPGIRSDADMFTFGYGFRPWNSLQTLADGPAIRQYIADTAREYGVDDKIHFGIRTTRACWCSQQRLWTLHGVDEASGAELSYTCRFLIPCTGYYSYDAGYLPDFPGLERFQGTFIHPQQWPEGLDYAGKRVLIIGSGATAVTLVPAMAAEAAHVTMLQRSPSYVLTVPGEDKLSGLLKRVLPERWVFGLARRRNIWLQRAIYQASRRWPQLVRRWLLAGVRKQLGDAVDMRHFTPSYMPWDERLCAVPDGDLFRVLRTGQASVVTDHIESFSERGVLLKSGVLLEADIIIAATGLRLEALGGTELQIDGERQATHSRMTYKGVLAQDMPNIGWIFGYTNAPWTLKSDLASRYLCRLLNHMQARGHEVVIPRAPAGQMEEGSVMDSMRSGYVQRGAEILPRQGRQTPWRVFNDFKQDRDLLLRQPVADEALEFS